MAKMKEISRNSIASWLSSDLGQTLPEFATKGSAGYGTVRRRFVPVTGKTVISPTGFLNTRSDQYQRVATFLQADLSGVGGLGDFLSDLAAKAKKAKDDAAAKISSAWDGMKSYFTDPAKFVNDLAVNAPGASAAMEKIAAQTRKTQDALDAMYVQVISVEKMKTQPQGFDKIKSDYYTRVGEFVQGAYAMYSVPEIAKRLQAAGVRKPNIKEDWVLKAVQAGKLSGQVYETIKAQNGTGALAGLGLAPIAIAGIVVAGLAALYMTMGAAEAAMLTGRTALRAWRDKEIVAKCAETKCSPDQLRAMLASAQAADAEIEKQRPNGGFGGILAAIPWVVGGALIFIFLPTLMAAGKAGGAAIEARRAAQVNGLARYRHRW